MWAAACTAAEISLFSALFFFARRQERRQKRDVCRRVCRFFRRFFGPTRVKLGGKRRQEKRNPENSRVSRAFDARKSDIQKKSAAKGDTEKRQERRTSMFAGSPAPFCRYDTFCDVCDFSRLLPPFCIKWGLNGRLRASRLPLSTVSFDSRGVSTRTFLTVARRPA